jgi:hypothetical protein
MRPRRVAEAVLVLALGLAAAGGAAAREFPPEDKKLLSRQKLSMPTVDRCFGAYSKVRGQAASNPALKKELEAADNDHVAGRTLTEQIGSIEQRYPVGAAAMKKEGCPIREFILTSASVSYAAMVSGIKSHPEKPGGAELAKEFDFVPPENVAFYEQNKEKLNGLFASLQRKEAPPSGSSAPR